MTDGGVFGLLGRWAAVDCWVAGRKLAVARELIRRRPGEESPGTATGSGLPWEWDDRLAHEVALELRTSVPGARKLLQAAWALEARLPGIGQALDDGRIDLARARMVIEETDVLPDPEQLARAEELILAGLDQCRTWTQLLRLVQRAVVTVDPQGAARRREKEERENARVSFWREAAGTSALLGTGLPTDEALQAHAHVDQRAQQYRAAGVKRPIDILRVAAYLDLLNQVPATDRITRFQAEDAAATAGPRPGPRASSGAIASPDASARAKARARDDDADGFDFQDYPPADGPEARGTAAGGTARSDRSDRDPGQRTCGGAAASEPPGAACGPAACGPATCGSPPCRCADPATTSSAAHPAADAGAGSGGPGGDTGPAVAAEVNLVLRHLDIPFLTAAGHAQRPGEARNLGPLDPALARQIAHAAARHPHSTFCLTIVNADGHAIGHGCAKPRRDTKPRKPRKQARARQAQGDAGFPPPPPSSPPAQGFTLRPNEGNGPPGGHGSWILTLPGQATEHVIDLHPVPTGECGHQYETAAHDPGALLRHLVNVRDGKCGFPACSRHARDTDFEHAQPFEQGGRTCGCNCWSASRSCHRVKQSPGWTVHETKPGYHQWTTPAGLTYTQEPWQYPT